ncbi:hypothetical protein E2C01_079378 [Portunus trituberculatus]|uniref:Uncharacterized protein n=1 Tax=Portunus trituberculatus TaxID=210409 RepID=A0A5B7IQG8_PORTR|nr:hypothetical protein [Portunus trituberculatus]
MTLALPLRQRHKPQTPATWRASSHTYTPYTCLPGRRIPPARRTIASKKKEIEFKACVGYKCIFILFLMQDS